MTYNREERMDEAKRETKTKYVPITACIKHMPEPSLGVPRKGYNALPIPAIENHMANVPAGVLSLEKIMYETITKRHAKILSRDGRTMTKSILSTNIFCK